MVEIVNRGGKLKKHEKLLKSIKSCKVFMKVLDLQSEENPIFKIDGLRLEDNERLGIIVV